MENQNKLKCEKNKEARLFCMTGQCSSRTQMCADSQCECHLSHKQCFLDIDINKILQQIDCEGKKYLPVLELLQKFLKETIKKLQVQLQYVITMKDEPSLTVRGLRQKLYKYITQNNKQIENVSSNEIIQFITSFKKQKINFNQHFESVKDILYFKQFQIDRLIEEIKPYERFGRQLQQVQQFYFSSKMQNKQPKPTTISMPLFSHIHQKGWMLLEPSISKIKQITTWRFKVLSQNQINDFNIGICHKKQMQAGAFLNIQQKFNKGLYVINHGGVKVSHINQNECGQSKFTIKSQQIIEISLIPDKQQIIFHNKNQNKYQKLSFQQEQGNQLYLCCKVSPGTTVNYVGFGFEHFFKPAVYQGLFSTIEN